MNDGSDGAELWMSDGTTAGTQMVMDINSGGAAANSFYLTNVSGTLFFGANDGTHGDELWRSNGTAAGTQMVADINPGTTGSYLGQLINMNGRCCLPQTTGPRQATLAL